MRILIPAVAVALAMMAGCAVSKSAAHHAEPASDTQECVTYRAMMTAPMEPRAHERLRLACDISRSTVGSK